MGVVCRKLRIKNIAGRKAARALNECGIELNANSIPFDPRKPFDPSVHEAMAQVARADMEPNTVIDVFQKGYQLRDRLVRPSRVVVSKEPDEGGKGEATD